MHTYDTAYSELANGLRGLYDNREAAAISHEILEYITGASRLQRLIDKDKPLDEVQEQLFVEIKVALLSGRPIQYVLGHGWFMGRKFKVNEHVLIPRPETEELVLWIADDYKGQAPAVLDIGTGSGCIPVSLKLMLPLADVSAIDVSEGALEVAQENATRLGADVRFSGFDFLDKNSWAELGSYNVIVSNPPYIPDTERLLLDAHVREHEPGQALFVPGDDALLFYRHIAEFGSMHLLPGGSIYCELHVEYAEATGELFRQMGYAQVELRKDMHGNTRMLKAGK